MKIPTLGVLALSCMAVVGSTVYAVTPAGGFGSSASASQAAPPTSATEATSSADVVEAATVVANQALFSAGSTVKVDARLGHATLDASSTRETFVLLELRGAGDGGQRAKVDLSIVIDKSGSMRGTRLTNALAAAERAVQRLRDGDSVSVVAFDTKVEVMLPQTKVDGASRSVAVEAVRKIRLGGDTCISCGIEQGVAELTRSGDSGSTVKNMLLLSDGDATAGVRDVPGFQTIAKQAMTRGVTITTIGVDVEFNERLMTAIALSSDGRHYFVENDKDLGRVFETEAAMVESSVASNAVAEIELASGVELVQLYDRRFERSGSRVSIPLGSFTRDETKTVLAKVKVSSASSEIADVASVRLAFRDLASGKEMEERGKLAVKLAKAEGDDLDGVVMDRLQKSETAAALNDANALFNEGKTEAARKRLEAAQTTLTKNREKAKKTAPTTRSGAVDKSFEAQETDLKRADDGFKAPPPAKGGAKPKADVQRDQKSTAKRAIEAANPYMK